MILGIGKARRPASCISEPRSETNCAFRDDPGDRQGKAACELHQRAALGDELRSEQRREDLQDQALAEPDHEIGAGRKHKR
jgi:hypothetical protein